MWVSWCWQFASCQPFHDSGYGNAMSTSQDYLRSSSPLPTCCIGSTKTVSLSGPRPVPLSTWKKCPCKCIGCGIILSLFNWKRIKRFCPMASFGAFEKIWSFIFQFPCRSSLLHVLGSTSTKSRAWWSWEVSQLNSVRVISFSNKNDVTLLQRSIVGRNRHLNELLTFVMNTTFLRQEEPSMVPDRCTRLSKEVYHWEKYLHS